jgi:serine/threonine-protein kinase
MAGFCTFYFFVGIFIPLLSPELGESLGLSPLITLITFGSFLLSLGVFFLARSRLLAPQQMLDVGLLYQICIGFIGGVVLKLAPGPMRMPEGWGISEICILILIFPVIVPNAPRKTLLAALVTASMDPLGVLSAWAVGKEMPSAASLFIAYVPNYFCAVLTLIPSLIMSRLGQQVSEARELGSYRLKRLLGRGGMGEVWQASHRLLARDAAVKVIRPESLGIGQDATVLLQRFEREAQATANLHSPHSISLYDYGISDDGTFFYVMELLDGIDLQTLIETYGPQPAERTIHILRQACDSLADAHQSDLVHRDIKPTNIHICRYGHQVDFIKILDFGLVLPCEKHSDDITRLTGEGSIPGTPAYMAPEMALGDQEIDGRADIYALGCVAYWLLTGQPVFERRTLMKTIVAHLEEDPVPPSQCTELEIPASLEGVLLSCLEKTPHRRPQSAQELDQTLAACGCESAWTKQRAKLWWKKHLPGRPK